MVIPAYNEAECIHEVLTQWCEVLDTLGLDDKSLARLIVVNDGSRDETESIVADFARGDARVTLVSQPGSGHGSAVLRGYRTALSVGAKHVFQVDSDNEFDPKDFAKLWRQRDVAPFVFGCRVKRATPLNRRSISMLLRVLLYLLFQEWIPDANVPYRLMKRDYLAFAIDRMPVTTPIPNIYLSTMAHKLQVRVIYLPVTHRKRTTGKVSLVSWRLIRLCMTSCYGLANWRVRFRSVHHNFAMHGMWITGTSGPSQARHPEPAVTQSHERIAS